MQKCIVALALSIGLTACESDAEKQREQSRQVEPRSSAAPDGSIQLTAEQIRANNIQTTAAVEENIAPAISAPGRIKPRSGSESQVFAPFAGRVIAAASSTPRVGNEVREGQLIGEVEQSFAASERVQFKSASLQLQTEIDQARQELDLRKKEADRARQLYDGGAIPLKDLQTAEFGVKQSQAKLDGAERAKTEYDQAASQEGGQRRTPLRAPGSGTVVAADLIAGEQVDPSKSLLKVVDTSSVWAELAVHESDLAQIRRSTTAEIAVASDPSRIYTGRLVNVGVALDPQNRTLPVTFEIPNPDRSLKLEMAVEGRVPAGPPQKTITVPASAVLSEQGVSSVFVEASAGVFQRRIVMAGQRRGDKITIVSGLQANEKVVATGAQSLNSEALKNLIPKDDEGGKR